MFQSQVSGAGAASNLPPSHSILSQPRPERVRHLVYGSLAGIDRTIKLLHRLGYAEPNDWSPPLPVPSPTPGTMTQEPPIPDPQPPETALPPEPLGSPEAQWMVILTKTLFLA